MSIVHESWSNDVVKIFAFSCKVAEIKGHVIVIGWDVSDAACEMAKFELGWETREVNFEVTIDIEHKDSLHPDLV
ncbi:hypothetical protein [Candidatus Villigracilis affinis]|uniref:hypothetical protein n=1 Tax=Candidatus Villigracilis affinis TaxID=3140682 RepID=UPI001DDD6106|nr:hypothetical protein [Anaerolineales bacterium]